MAGELWRSKSQAAVEVTAGTAVAAATRKLYWMDPTLQRVRDPRPKKFAVGTRDNQRAFTLGPEQLSGKAKLDMSADEIIEPLLLGVKGAVTPTQPTGATNGYDWAFTPGTALDTMTFQFNDGARDWRATGVRVDKLKISGSVDKENTIDLDLLGFLLSQTAFSGTPTDRIPVYHEGWETQLAIGTFGVEPESAAIITGTLVNWDIEIDNGQKRKYFAANSNTVQAITLGELVVKAKLLFEASASQALTEFSNWDAATKRLVRLTFGGNTAISGDTAVNEVQTVTLTGSPGGGTFKLTFRGQETSSLAYNESAANVQTALRALSTIGGSNVSVSGSNGGPFTVTFSGDLAGQKVGILTLSTNSLTGGTNPSATIVRTTPGYSPYKHVRLHIPAAWSAFDLGQKNDDTRAYMLEAEYIYDPTNLTAGLQIIARNDRASAW